MSHARIGLIRFPPWLGEGSVFLTTRHSRNTADFLDMPPAAVF
jgi:hypothetical protein